MSMVYFACGIVLGLIGSFFIWKNNRSIMDEGLDIYNDIVGKLDDLAQRLKDLEKAIGLKKDGK